MPPIVYRNKGALLSGNFSGSSTFWEFFTGGPDFAVRIECELSDKLQFVAST